MLPSSFLGNPKIIIIYLKIGMPQQNRVGSNYGDSDSPLPQGEG